MLLTMSTWSDVEHQLAVSRTVVVPIGSHEQHGPTGLLGTDALCPEIIAHAAEKKDPRLLVAPTFSVGMAQHHLAFPGSITLRPSTFIAAIGDWVRSLHRHGFDRIYFLNGHGGNVASIEAAFSELYVDASFAGRPAGFACKLKNWWDLKGVVKLCGELYPVGHGSHATPSEIAVTQYAYPDTIKMAAYAPEIAATGPIRDALDFRARYPDGRMGSHPALASPEGGRRIVDLAVPALLADVAEFTAEAAPGALALAAE
jgi:creatinine amidohydrolase/Fe(II)-dependent formamide hydrolase-like protein